MNDNILQQIRYQNWRYLQLLTGPSLFMTRHRAHSACRKKKEVLTPQKGGGAVTLCVRTNTDTLAMLSDPTWPWPRVTHQTGTACVCVCVCVCFSMLVWLKKNRQKRLSVRKFVQKMLVNVLQRQTKLLLRLCCIWARKVRLPDK